MSKGAYAVFRLTFPSEREADIISKSILPETEATARYRSRVKVTKEGKCITLTFESKDTTALRASVNSYLNWIMLLRNIYSFLESQKQYVE